MIKLTDEKGLTVYLDPKEISMLRTCSDTNGDTTLISVGPNYVHVKASPGEILKKIRDWKKYEVCAIRISDRKPEL